MFYGMRYIVENFVARQWTQRDVDEAALFFKCALRACNEHRTFRTACRGWRTLRSKG